MMTCRGIINVDMEEKSYIHHCVMVMPDDERICQTESTLDVASFHGRALDPRFNIQGLGTHLSGDPDNRVRTVDQHRRPDALEKHLLPFWALYGMTKPIFAILDKNATTRRLQWTLAAKGCSFASIDDRDGPPLQRVVARSTSSG